MEDFVAVDLETATEWRGSICEIGLTEVVNGIPQEPLSWLVQPDGNEYDIMNIWVHGIKPQDTANSPSFRDVWKEVLPHLQGKLVVAHNTSFDMYALRDALEACNAVFPEFDYVCSLRIAKYLIKGCDSYCLPALLCKFGIDIDRHHRAGADSLGCAKLFVKLMEMSGKNIDDLEKEYQFHRGCFRNDKFVAQLSTKSHGNGTDYSKIIKDITSDVDPSKFDEGNYFYGKNVCFTGTCQFAQRKNLLAKVAEVGGIPTNSVSKHTDILVVGQQDYRVVGEDGMSSKQKRALELLSQGVEIEIMSETEFMGMI